MHEYCNNVEYSEKQQAISIDRKHMNIFGSGEQGLSQDLGTGCPKFLILKFLCVLFFKGYHKKLGLQPYICIYFIILK